MATKDGISIVKPFNPLDKNNLGESVAMALVNSPVHRLPPNPFIGAGVYMLYYLGDYPLYKPLTERNKNGKFLNPIYIGKAVPAGTRKGRFTLELDHGTALLKRLTEHSQSINAANNLRLEDFYCRFLVVDDIWISLAESLLIEKFAPVWNIILDGFGNHNPGKGRHRGKMPFWDCVHPGRDWAFRLQPCASSKNELEAKVAAYLLEQFPDKLKDKVRQ
ncbi:MAG: Eco29kI family restriction endonuclease [Desulfovibrionaceae bacterium]|nr:Eco29kI family restriction endonuclease [Desulfovibrionaceae bacterium]